MTEFCGKTEKPIFFLNIEFWRLLQDYPVAAIVIKEWTEENMVSIPQGTRTAVALKFPLTKHVVGNLTGVIFAVRLVSRI